MRFPEQLLPQEREAAWRMLQATDFDRQLLLDELAGRLQAAGSREQAGMPGGVRSPLGYLRSLIQRAAQGRFVPELAPRVSALRTDAQSCGTSKRQDLQAQQGGPSPGSSPGPSPCALAVPQVSAQGQRDRARELLADLSQRLAKRKA